MRENVRAQLRVIVKRILRKYGYPPDKQEKATQTVLGAGGVVGVGSGGVERRLSLIPACSIAALLRPKIASRF